MRFSTALSIFLFILPVLQEVSGAGILPRQNKGKGDGGGGGGGNVPTPSPTVANPAPEQAGNTPNARVQNNNNGGNNGGNNGDPQKSLTVDPRVLAQGFAQNGQNPPVAGQVASLTSTNNFINFCLTVPNLPITNGQQIQSGSCNPAPIGAIPSIDNMPSAKFVFPKNTQSIPANQKFTLQLSIKNLGTGNFVNAQKNYFAAPQQLQGGTIKGHSHAVIEKLSAIDQTTPTNPKDFVFFKGLNEAAQGGILTADVTNGVPPGAYRVCSINTSSNHQPVIVPVAQHGSLDDCSYFQAVVGGGNGGGGGGGGGGTGGAETGGGAATPAAPGNPPPSPAPNNGGGGNGGGGNGGGGKGGGRGGGGGGGGGGKQGGR